MICSCLLCGPDLMQRTTKNCLSVLQLFFKHRGH
uniref:Uncharacterized protein n=1 Tax=Rhizophora mucronata TaxID=61149 RepID=A0A2P2QH07_RHIMU